MTAAAAQQIILPLNPSAQTSKDAAISIAHCKPKYLARALDVIKEAGERGVTTDEIKNTTGLKRSTVSARIADLIHAGLVRRSELKRASDSGRLVWAWVAVTETVDHA